MDRTDLATWLDAYRHAWTTDDADGDRRALHRGRHLLPVALRRAVGGPRADRREVDRARRLAATAGGSSTRSSRFEGDTGVVRGLTTYPAHEDEAAGGLRQHLARPPGTRRPRAGVRGVVGREAGADDPGAAETSAPGRPSSAARAAAMRATFARHSSAGTFGSRSSQTASMAPRICHMPSGRARNQTWKCSDPSPQRLTWTRPTSGRDADRAGDALDHGPQLQREVGRQVQQVVVRARQEDGDRRQPMGLVGIGPHDPALVRPDRVGVRMLAVPARLAARLAMAVRLGDAGRIQRLRPGSRLRAGRGHRSRHHRSADAPRWEGDRGTGRGPVRHS